MDRQMERQSQFAHYPISFDQGYLKDSSIKQDSNFKSFDQQSQPNAEENIVQRRARKNLQNDQISLLFDKKRNLENFMDNIGDYSTQPIRNDILDHCEKVSINIPGNLNKIVILKLVKNRVDKMIKNKRIKKNWSEEDINILVWVISKYCQFHGISNSKDGITQADWTNIADLIPGVTGKSCMFKWLSLKKSNLAENSWVQQESLLLDQMVKKYGQENWCKISQQLYLNNNLTCKIYRCPKQCRQHWNCYLNPKLKKGPWEKKQDYLLLRAVKQLQGVKKWAQIVKMFNGRTQNALKNRFTLIIQKQMKELKNKKKLNQLQLVQHYLRKNESNHEIDGEKLKFLSQKRQILNENQLKKKPKKSKAKKIKEQVYSEQQEQYVPDDAAWRTQKRVLKQKTKVKQMENEEEYKIQQINQKIDQRSEIFERDESLNPAISMRKQEPIFEEQQDLNEQIKQEYGGPQVNRFAIPNNYNTYWGNDEHTNEQNLTIINPNEVKFVPYSEEQFRTLTGKGTLIPCAYNQSSQTLEFHKLKK